MQAEALWNLRWISINLIPSGKGLQTTLDASTVVPNRHGPEGTAFAGESNKRATARGASKLQRVAFVSLNLLVIEEATAIAGRKRGWMPLISQLAAKQEQCIEEAFNALRKKPGPVGVVDLVVELVRSVGLLRAPCPSRPAIDQRLQRCAGVKVHHRGVAVPGTADPRISPGSFVAQRPLDVVKLDRTAIDIVVVDDLYRQPLSRPNLTLATDEATRGIFGFVISVLPPGAATASLCLTFAVSPKADRLKQLGVAGVWPMVGLSKTLHLEGAAECKSKTLREPTAAAQRLSGLELSPQRLLDFGNLRLQPPSRASAVVHLQLQGDARKVRGQRLEAVGHYGHHLGPFAFEDRSHRRQLVRHATAVDEVEDARHVGAHAFALPHRSDREFEQNHL
jgi:hypothetical protein